MTSAARLSPPALIAWIAIAGLVALLLLATGGYDGIYAPTLRALNVALAGLALLAWVVVAWRRPEFRRITVLWPALLVALAAVALSTVGSSAPRLSLEYLGYAIVLAALYAMLVALLAQEGVRVRFGALVVVLCGLIALAFILSAVEVWIDWWELVGRITTPPLRPAFQGLNYGNPSAVMTIVLLLLASAVAHLGFGSRTSRLTVVILTALALVVIVLSGSRAGWLAVAVAVLVTAVALLLSPEHRANLRSMAADRRVQIAAVPLAIAGLVAAVVFGPGLLLRFGAGGEATRTAFYAASVRMFEDAPLLGQGAGTWPMRRVEYTLPTETDYYIPHAHNIYLQTLAELGVVGVAAGVVALVFLGMLIWRGLRDPDPRRRRFAWAALFATVYLGAHQFLDFYANMPAALLALAFPIAWLDATSPRSIVAVRLPVMATRIAIGASVGSVALATLGLLASELPASHHRDAVQLANAGLWGEALPLARSAAERDPDIPAYQFTLGLAEARAGNADAAEVALLRVAEADDMPIAWLDVAKLRLDRGDAAGATEALEEALRLGRQNPQVTANAALLWQALNNRSMAVGSLADAVAAAPTLAGDPYWHDDPDRSALMSAAVQAASSRGSSVAFAIALGAEDLERAAGLANAFINDEERALAQLLVEAWSGDPEAIVRLRQRCAERPLEPTTVEWCVRLAVRLGDERMAERYRNWAAIIEGPAGWAAGIVRSRPQLAGSSGMTRPNDSAGSAGYYGQFTYRRMLPWILSLPGMLQLSIE